MPLSKFKFIERNPIEGEPGYENYVAYGKELRKFLLEEYIRISGVDLLPSKLRDSIKKTFNKDNIACLKYSHYNRFTVTQQHLSTTYLFTKTQQICATFKAQFDDTSCIYSYLYAKYDVNEYGYNKLYVNTGASLNSHDGEYRHRLITYTQFLQILDRYSNILMEIEEAIVAYMNEKRLSFHIDLFYPFGFTGNKRKFEDSINDERMPIKLFAISWVIDYTLLIMGMSENHINPAYTYIITRKKFRSIFDKLTKEVGIASFKPMLNHMSKYYPDFDNPLSTLIHPEVGQKLFPMTLGETTHPLDINYSVWRELYVTNLCADLVNNLVSGGFPMPNNWFLIQNTHADIFDNTAMHARFEHSTIATDVVVKLKDVDKINFASQNTSDYISGKFKKLSDSIKYSVRYANDALRLTNVVLCATSEYVGRTIKDMPGVAVNATSETGNRMLFTDYNMFAKIMFEFIYSFFCMNSRIGIIHGDFHLNNGTINRLYDFYSKGKINLENPKVVFYLGTQQDLITNVTNTINFSNKIISMPGIKKLVAAPQEKPVAYVFDYNGFVGTVIDFSRSIIGNVAQLENDFGKVYTDQFIKAQNKRMIKLFERYIPKLTSKFIREIKAKLLSDFPLMFKIATLCDTYSISQNMLVMISIGKEFATSKEEAERVESTVDAFNMIILNKIIVHPNIIPLLKRIQEQSESMLANLLQLAIENKIDYDNLEWPNKTLLTKCFKEFEVTGDIVGNVVDVFNYANPLKYSFKSFETYSPLTSINKIIEMRKKYDVGFTPDYKEWFNYVENLANDASVDNIADGIKEQEGAYI